MRRANERLISNCKVPHVRRNEYGWVFKLRTRPLVLFLLSIAGILWTDILGRRSSPFQRCRKGPADTIAGDKSLLLHEIKVQETFQNIIKFTQFPTIPCKRRRIATTAKDDKMLDGFALDMQWIGRQLQVAIASNRTLVVHPSWQSAYAPPDKPCQWMTTNHSKLNTSRSWECLFESITNCTFDLIHDDMNVRVQSSLSSGIGLIDSSSMPTSKLFNVYYHGPTRVVELIPFRGQWKRDSDHVENWERLLGRFWVRSQLQHFLWRPSRGMQQVIFQRTPLSLQKFQQQKKHFTYVGIHLRMTDNVQHFKRDFGRDVNQTRSIKRIQDLLGQARRDFPRLELRHVYISTDNSEALKKCRNSLKNWTVLVQDKVIRSNRHKMMWFRNIRRKSAPGIATDLEVMRRADILIGSHQSNVFRLATELNTAYHTGHYAWSVNRHYTFDVEWYEDP